MAANSASTTSAGVCGVVTCSCVVLAMIPSALTGQRERRTGQEIEEWRYAGAGAMFWFMQKRLVGS